MKKKSILLNPAGTIVSAVFSMIMFFLIFSAPANDASENIYPVIKVPRPYNAHIAGLNHLNDDPKCRVSKKESFFYPIINQAADKHNVDPALIKAIIKAESGYNPIATSEKGAIGLMQIMPNTASAFSSEDMYDPVYNINAGVEYLKNLLNQFDGNLELTLASYTTGPGKVKECQGVPPNEVTINYIKKVLEYYRYYLEA
jgi:soluble lytic murein transglycosylase-like protein